MLWRIFALQVSVFNEGKNAFEYLWWGGGIVLTGALGMIYGNADPKKWSPLDQRIDTFIDMLSLDNPEPRL